MDPQDQRRFGPFKLAGRTPSDRGAGMRVADWARGGGLDDRHLFSTGLSPYFGEPA